MYAEVTGWYVEGEESRRSLLHCWSRQSQGTILRRLLACSVQSAQQLVTTRDGIQPGFMRRQVASFMWDWGDIKSRWGPAWDLTGCMSLGSNLAGDGIHCRVCRRVKIAVRCAREWRRGHLRWVGGPCVESPRAGDAMAAARCQA